MSVAMVIPEIGFDEEPMSPVMRDDTVAKKKPKTRISTAARTLPCVGRPGVTIRKMASSSEPTSTTAIGMSRSVRARPDWPAPAPKILDAATGRRDDRRNRARQGDEARGQHRAGADVADVGAPQLPGRHLGSGTAGRWRVVANGWIGGKGSVMKLPRIESSGRNTSHDSTPPANIVPAMRGPIT